MDEEYEEEEYGEEEEKDAEGQEAGVRPGEALEASTIKLRLEMLHSAALRCRLPLDILYFAS